MPIQIHKPHDAIFRKFFTDIEVANEFIKAYFIKELQEKCDLSTLKIEAGSFLEEDLRQHYSDILYSLKIDGVKSYVYINVEHQSTPDELMPFRMLRYKLAIMKQHLDQGHKKLPAVIPMLFYHGRKGPYPFSLELIDCFEDKNFAKKYFFNVPILVDLTQIPDETFTRHKKLGLLETVQKNIFTRDLVAIAKNIVQLMKSIHPDHELFNSLVYYMLVEGETQDVNETVKTLQTIKDYQEDVMNAAQQLKQQGRMEGLQQGREEGREEGRHEGILAVARRLLVEEGLSPQAVQRLTGLPENEVMDLINKH